MKRKNNINGHNGTCRAKPIQMEIFLRALRALRGLFQSRHYAILPIYKGGNMRQLSFLSALTITILFFTGFTGILQADATPPAHRTKERMKRENTSPPPKYQLGTLGNPIKCDGGDGAVSYFRSLRDKNGNTVIFKRTGHGGQSPNGHQLDKYEIHPQDGSNSMVVFVDIYFQGYKETTPLEGFTLASPTPVQPVVNKPENKKKATPATTKQARKTKPNTKPNTRATAKSKTNSKTKLKHQAKRQKRKSSKKTIKKPVTTKKKPRPTPANDKIPGFDDVPESSPPKKQKTVQAAPPAKKIIVTQSHSPKPNRPQTAQKDYIPGFDDSPSQSAATPGQYLSIIPIMDNAKKKMPKKKNTMDWATVINPAVNDALAKADNGSNVKFQINTDGYTIAGNPGKIKQLRRILNGKGDNQEKFQEIKEDILEPVGIDVIVTGTFQYHEKSRLYIVKPVFISLPDDKIIIPKEIAFQKKLKKGIIKNRLKRKITESLKKSCPGVMKPGGTSSGDSGPPVPQPPEEIYVTFIPFASPSATGKHTAKKLSLADMLNTAIENGARKARKQNNSVAVNSDGHTLHDSQPLIAQLNKIISNRKLTRDEITQKIVDEIMTPNHVDYLIYTQYENDTKNKIITLQPHAVSRALKKNITVNLIFTNEELLCKSPKDKNTALCQTARENIEDEIRRLVGQVVK